MTDSGEGLGVIGYCTEASLNNGLGHYAGALTAAERACECPQEIGFSTLVLPGLIEAASRSGNTQRASDALEELEELAETTRASGTDWALGIEARSRALISEGTAAGATTERQSTERQSPGSVAQAYGLRRPAPISSMASGYAARSVARGPVKNYGSHMRCSP